MNDKGRVIEVVVRPAVIVDDGRMNWGTHFPPIPSLSLLLLRCHGPIVGFIFLPFVFQAGGFCFDVAPVLVNMLANELHVNGLRSGQTGGCWQAALGFRKRIRRHRVESEPSILVSDGEKGCDKLHYPQHDVETQRR